MIKKSLGLAGMVLGVVAVSSTASAQSGYTWSTQSSGTTAQLNSVAMLNDSFGVAVGAGRTALFYNGTTWTSQDASASGFGATTVLSSAAVTGTNSVFIAAAGSSASTRGFSTWDGSAWSSEIQAGPNDDSIFSLWTSSGTLALTGRGSGRVTQYDGGAGGITTNTNWSRTLNIGTVAINSIHGTSPSSIWAVGSVGTVYNSTDAGGTWSQITDPIVNDTGIAWNGVFAQSGTGVWLAGTGGKIAKWNGTSWSIQTVNYAGSPEDFRSITGISGAGLWAVGLNGAVVHFDGTTWSDVSTGIGTTDLYSISATGDGHLWAVGENGTILKAIPEPAISMLLLLFGMVALMRRRSRGTVCRAHR